MNRPFVSVVLLLLFSSSSMGEEAIKHIVKCYPLADTYVSAAEPDTSFGDSINIIVGNSYGDSYIGLWTFDLSQIPKDEIIADVVWVSPKYDYSGYKSDIFYSSFIVGEWDEYLVTLNNASSVYSDDAISESAEKVEAPLPLRLNFTTYGMKIIKSMIKGDIPNYGLDLILCGTGDARSESQLFTVYSKESTDPCYLEVTWVEIKK